MKLDTRRTIRQAALDAPRGTWTGLVLVFILAGAVGFRVDDTVLLAAGIVGFLGVFWAKEESTQDACSNCKSPVNALADRYCDVCGHRLDDLDAAPPIDERVSERSRPVGLEKIEHEPAVDESEPIPTIADGGDLEEADS